MPTTKLTKACRLCWNTSGWQWPTGEAGALETGSYVASHDFGHEEWLLNLDWLLKKGGVRYRYGFLQPVGKHLDLFRGATLDILLYAVAPTGDRLLVGTLVDVYVPEEEEMLWATKETKKKGWLDEMRSHLSRLGISNKPLARPTPQSIMNVRFTPTAFTPLELRRVGGSPNFVRSNRYVAYKWDGHVPTTGLRSSGSPPKPTRSGVDPRRSEDERTRAAIKGTTYDPVHVRLQNRLWEHLKSRYGKKAVRYEEDYVDLAITDEAGGVTYFELKTAASARRCIREAFGQLMDYSIYPDSSRARRLVVVGVHDVTNEDRLYLAHVRNKFKLPLYYARFNQSTTVLSDPQ